MSDEREATELPPGKFRIYLAMESWDYEGTTVHAIFATAQEAAERCYKAWCDGVYGDLTPHLAPSPHPIGDDPARYEIKHRSCSIYVKTWTVERES